MYFYCVLCPPQLCETHICVMSLQSDYHFEYTDCDVLGSRWRVAIPNKANTCTGLPDPVKGTQCSEFTIVRMSLNAFSENVQPVLQLSHPMCTSPWSLSATCDPFFFVSSLSSLLLYWGGVSGHAVAGVQEVCCGHLLSGHRRGLWRVGRPADWFHHLRGDDERGGQPHRLLQVSVYCTSLVFF